MEEENKLSFYFYKIVGIMAVSLLFTVCSIPVITIGAALTALHDAIISELEGKDTNKLKVFQASIRKNMNNATIIWLFILSGYAVFGGITYVLSKSGGELIGVLLAVCVVFLSLITMICMYVFPLQARFKKKTTKQMYNALILSIKCFPTTIILALMLALLALVFYFKTDVFLIFFALIGFGAFAYVYDYFMLRCLKPYLETTDVKKEKQDADKLAMVLGEDEKSDNEAGEDKGESLSDGEEIDADEALEINEEKISDAENENTDSEFEEEQSVPKKKSIELSDAAEDEKRRIEAIKAAEEEARKKAVFEADLAARNTAKELADRVKESSFLETAGENIYRRTAVEEAGGRSVGKQKKKQRKL